MTSDNERNSRRKGRNRAFDKEVAGAKEFWASDDALLTLAKVNKFVRGHRSDTGSHLRSSVLPEWGLGILAAVRAGSEFCVAANGSAGLKVLDQFDRWARRDALVVAFAESAAVAMLYHESFTALLKHDCLAGAFLAFRSPTSRPAADELPEEILMQQCLAFTAPDGRAVLVASYGRGDLPESP